MRIPDPVSYLPQLNFPQYLKEDLPVPIALPLFLTWLLYFPDEVPAPGRGARAWPWLFLPVGPMYLSGVLGVPLSESRSNLADSLAMVMLTQGSSARP